MSQIKKIFFLALLPIMLLSCGDGETGSEGLRLGLSTEAIIIPIEGRNNCVFPPTRIDKSYFKINVFNLEWDRADQDLTLSYVRVDVKSSALESEYVAVMDADDLSQFLVYENDSGANSNIENGLVPAPAEGETRFVFNRSNCSLPFGGLDVDEDSRNFTITGRMEVRGIAVGNIPGEDGNLGEERPVRARASFRLTYDFN